MITIYHSTETDYSGNGLATLTPTHCIVSEALNGDYQLEMLHPIDAGGIWRDLVEDRILRAPSYKGNDLFRIYRIDKTMQMVLRVYAGHITYDLLTDFIENNAPTNASAEAALRVALMRTAFQGTSNVAGSNSVRWIRKNPLACIMGDEDNSIVNRWGGEVNRQARRIDVLARLGEDRGVEIRYRKNMTGLDISVDMSGVATRVMPTGLKEDGQTVLSLPETFVDSPLIDHYAKVRTAHIHYGDIKVEEDGAYPTEDSAFEALRDRVAKAYEDGLDKPDISAKVAFVDLSKTIEYAKYKQLEKVSLGDVVHIWHSALQVQMSARVVAVKWDCLRGQYETITIGQEGVNLSAVISQQNKQVRQEAMARTDTLQAAIDDATGILNSPGNGYVRFIPNIANPSEILIMDAPNPEDAQEVMRLNKNGWGLSQTGINGPFITAATAKGIVANSITAGTLQASLIKILGSDLFYWMADNLYLISPQDSLRQIRIGMYDGVNMGIGYTTDGGITWNNAIGFDGAHFGNSIAGFDIGASGLTNGDTIQLMSNGFIRLGGIRMDGGDHPYISFEYNGLRAFYVGEGVFRVDQVFEVNGPVYFNDMETTTQPPNMYRDPISKRVKLSTWVPSSGGGTDPGGGGDIGSEIDVEIEWTKLSASVGDSVTATTYVNKGSPTSYLYKLYRDGSLMTSQTSTSRTFSFSPILSGSYIIEVEATGAGGWSDIASSSPCQVGSG